MMQYWGCGEPYCINNCPRCGRLEQIMNIQEDSTLGEVARTIPEINVALEYCEANYQPDMIEIVGKIFNHTLQF